MSDYQAPKRSYAVRVQTIDIRIVVSIMAREDNAGHPINCKGDGEAQWDGAPKKMAGLHLDGLCLRAFRSADRREDGSYQVYDFDLCYTDIYSANARKVAGMAKTIAKAAKGMDKAGGSPELQLVAFCKALGVDQTVTRTTGHGRSSYSESEWQWNDGVELAAFQLRNHIKALEKGQTVTA